MAKIRVTPVTNGLPYMPGEHGYDIEVDEDAAELIGRALAKGIASQVVDPDLWRRIRAAVEAADREGG